MKSLTVRLALVGSVLSLLACGSNSARPTDSGTSNPDATQGRTGGQTGTGNSGVGGVFGAGGASGSGVGSGTGSSGGVGGAGFVGCSAGGPQCNNCVDDDNDGRIDAADPECVGSIDNDESSFATGIPGDNSDACKQDCFFDGDSGAGNDGCDWNLKCDPLNPGAHAAKPCPYDSGFSNCSPAQSMRCLNTCGAATPNGCDCFGCCAVPGAATAIKLASTCTAASYNDPTKCPACTQVAECLNICGRCEVCVGKPTVPADCFPTGAGGNGGAGSGGNGGAGAGGAGGGTDSPCPGTIKYCGPGGIAPQSCPSGTYCTTGCCTPIIF